RVPSCTARAGRSVDRVLQRLAGLEAGVHRGGDLDLLAGARVAAGARGALAHVEGAEADERDAVALLQRIGDHGDHRVDRTAGVGARQVGGASDGFDEFGFVHCLLQYGAFGRKRSLYQRPLGEATRKPRRGAGFRAPRHGSGDLRQCLASGCSEAAAGSRAVSGSGIAGTGALGASGRSRARSSTSSIQRTGTISIASATDFGMSARSLRFSSGMITVRTPPRIAASSFSLRPPIASTLPRRVISPVIAT